jgi:hypothetical protein
MKHYAWIMDGNFGRMAQIIIIWMEMDEFPMNVGCMNVLYLLILTFSPFMTTTKLFYQSNMSWPSNW